MAKNRDEHRKRLVESNYGITAIGKLVEQLRIQDRRIRKNCDHFQRMAIGPDEDGFLVTNVLELDLETFYTIAHDLLKLVGLFVPNHRAFERQPIYKTICSIRSRLVRHAYDKANGVPYSGYGFGEDTGPQLKSGSGDSFQDPGYYLNHSQLIDLLKRYQVTTGGFHRVMLDAASQQPSLDGDTAS